MITENNFLEELNKIYENLKKCQQEVKNMIQY